MNKLVILDMDGTLLAQRTVDVLCEAYNLKNELDKIDKESSKLPAFKIAEKVAKLFQDIAVRDIQSTFNKIPLNPYVEEFIEFIRQEGFITAIATDSYQFLAENLAKKLNVNLVYGLDVEIINGRFTGRITSEYKCQEIRGCRRYYVCKLWFLRQCRRLFNPWTITIGDGESDFCMSTESDFAIAFNPKSKSLEGVCDLKVSSFSELLDLDYSKFI
ncbi:MAG: HAD-IB family phosphatase [Nitrososphaeria archaeon]